MENANTVVEIRTAPPVSIAAEFPATANQAHYWTEAHLPGGGAALNASFRRRITGRLSDSAIAHALQALIDRHEILRTRFRERAEGGLVQEVLEGIEFKFDIVDLRHLPDQRREEELLRLGRAEARKPFAFTGGVSPAPLFRVLMVRTAPDDAVIHFTFHHLIMDGWSVDIVVDEFGRLAAARDAGTSLELPPVSLHFGDYALWQEDVLAGPALDRERDYWKGQLADLPRFEVEPDRPRGDADDAAEIRSLMLPRELSDAFESAARAAGHTLFSYATAAAAAALHLVTDEAEIVLGTQMALRDDPDAERVVGPLLNTVVLRLPVSAPEMFPAFADRVRSVAFEAMANQHLPFGETARIVGAEHAPGRPLLYSVNIIVQHNKISSSSNTNDDYGAFNIISLPSCSAGALWDLSFFMVGREEGWRISCEGSTALYDNATIDALLAVWKQVIEQIIARPDVSIASLARLAPQQRRPSRCPADRSPVTRAPRAVVNPRLEALRERILPLQPKGARTPVLALNGTSVLYPVAREIGTDRPFFDIQFCPSRSPIPLPNRHFSDYARDAVELIRLARPHGPYVLFGFCIYGAIAVEAARILQSEGEQVPLVILNDTYRPGFRENMPFLDRQIRQWQVRWSTSASLYKRVRSGELPLAGWIDNYRIARQLRISRILASIGLIARGPDSDPMLTGDRWFAEGPLRVSQAGFTLEPYTGNVIMFRCQELVQTRLFPRDFGWRGHVEGSFDVTIVPGNHETMFRPEGARVIGSRVRAALDQLGA